MTRLLLRYWAVGLAMVLAGVLAIAWHQRDEALRAEGAARERLAAVTAKLHVDSLTAHTRDSVVRVDTVRYVRWATKYDTAVKTLRITDTIEVKRFVSVADSTIGACRQVVTSLSLSCAAKDSVIQDLRAIVRLQPRTVSRSSWREKLAWGVGGLAVGVMANRAWSH